jgi:hypothetical protein
MTGNKLTFKQNKSKESPLLLFIIENKATLNSKKRFAKIRKTYLFKEKRMNPILSNKSNCH